jgi:hypothetical protein
VPHTRDVHSLHFLVDGIRSPLWENGITVDSATPPAGAQVPSLVELRLSWRGLCGLYAAAAARPALGDGDGRGGGRQVGSGSGSSGVGRSLHFTTNRDDDDDNDDNDHDDDVGVSMVIDDVEIRAAMLTFMEES